MDPATQLVIAVASVADLEKALERHGPQTTLTLKFDAVGTWRAAGDIAVALNGTYFGLPWVCDSAALKALDAAEHRLKSVEILEGSLILLEDALRNGVPISASVFGAVKSSYLKWLCSPPLFREATLDGCLEASRIANMARALHFGDLDAAPGEQLLEGDLMWLFRHMEIADSVKGGRGSPDKGACADNGGGGSHDKGGGSDEGGQGGGGGSKVPRQVLKFTSMVEEKADKTRLFFCRRIEALLDLLEKSLDEPWTVSLEMART